MIENILNQRNTRKTVIDVTEQEKYTLVYVLDVTEQEKYNSILVIMMA